MITYKTLEKSDATWGLCRDYLYQTIEVEKITIFVDAQFCVHQFYYCMEVYEFDYLYFSLQVNGFNLTLDLNEIKKDEPEFYKALQTAADQAALAKAKQSNNWLYDYHDNYDGPDRTEES